MHFFSEINYFLTEAKRRNSLLFYLAVALTFLFLLFLLSFWVCGSPPVADICYWLKPFKFSLSFAMYVLTLGWLMEYIRPDIGEKNLRRVSVWTASLIVIQMTAVFLLSIQFSQAYAYLQLSEKSTEFIAKALATISDAGIVLTSAVVVYAAFYFFRNISLQPKSYLLGIRTGFIVFISSCLLGVFLLAYYDQMPPDQEHFGLPFTQLHSVKSNLISVHFFGIHAMQLFPLIGYYFKEHLANLVITVLALAYFGAMLFFLCQLL